MEIETSGKMGTRHWTGNGNRNGNDSMGMGENGNNNSHAAHLQYVARDRLENFVVGMTNDDPATTLLVYKTSYTLCGQFNGTVDPRFDATVSCSPSSQKFRYVIVQGSKDALCLTEVYVYERSK